MTRMTKSDEFRANAVDCMKLAAAVNDSTARLLFVQMADGWLRLADHVELGKQYEPGDGAVGSSGPDLSRESNLDREP
jgi:hypothetical protein